MRKILEQCPTCGGDLAVTELSCTSCETVIRGRYEPCLFCRLSPEDLSFLELFVKNRGNVKEMERELGISYWSIRTRLDEVVARIGFEETLSAPADNSRHQRREILERLDRGEISVAEATELLSTTDLGVNNE
jgi:hypothetical protein